MTTNFPGESAKIFQFPARGRFAAADSRDQSESAKNLMSPRVAKITFGGAWYHDAAIQDAERPRQN
jgi:hypothetical protein